MAAALALTYAIVIDVTGSPLSPDPLRPDPLTPDEIRAAAQIHRELGPDYEHAVIESFLDRIGKEIDARVDARLAEERATRAPQGGSPSGQALALGSIALGIPVSAIVVSAGSHPVGFMGLLVVWLAIAAINVAYAIRSRPPRARR